MAPPWVPLVFPLAHGREVAATRGHHWLTGKAIRWTSGSLPQEFVDRQEAALRADTGGDPVN